MRSTTRLAWLSTIALLFTLGLASLHSSPPTVSAAGLDRSAQLLDPTLQALATQAALAVIQAQGMPTPNPTDLARAIDRAGAITIQGTLTISGATQISATYTTQLLNIAGIRPDVVSCAVFAQGIRNADGTGFAVPDPGVASTVGGHAVLIPVSVSPYPGPGDYNRDHGVKLGAGVVVDQTNYLVPEDGQDYHVVVNADGSGSFTFANLHAGSLDAAQASDASISGSDSWTCSPQP